jgi:uncharacterized membrane protein (UPF0127 family)
MRLILLIVPLLIATLAACGGDDDDSGGGTPTPSPIPLPTSEFTIRTTTNEETTFTAEIADIPDELRFGLMFRESMPEDHGMLFVFQTDTTTGFWMQNTYIPLSVAFIDVTGKIVDIQDMEPLDETLHSPEGTYRYALEMNQGWFEDNGIEPGDRLLGPLPAPGGS